MMSEFSRISATGRRSVLKTKSGERLAEAEPDSTIAQSGNEEVVLVASGGALATAFKEYFYDAFTKATGIKITFVPISVAEKITKLKAMNSVGKVEWDIVAINLDQIAAFQQYFAPLDCSSLPNVATFGIPGACDGHSLIKQLDGHNLVFSTKAFPAGGKQPQNWADFWDVKTFPGPRSLPDHGTPWVAIAAALMADGVPASSIRPPLDIERAIKKLDEIKPHIKVWWKTGDQSQQIMRDNEAAMIMAYSGRALRSKSLGVPIDMTWNQAIMSPGRWTILKGAPNPKAAMAFLDYFMTRPEAHAAFTKQIFYDTANKRAAEFMAESDRPNSALFGDNLKKAVLLDYELASWLGKNHDKLIERWNVWIAK
jgi:mannopine transport system substrate-binding protein